MAVTPGRDRARSVKPARLASAIGGLPYFGAEDLSRLLTVTEAADAIETALSAGNGGPSSPQRWPVPLSAGELLLMPCEQGAFGGVKVTTVAGDDPARVGPRIGGLYILWDAATLALLALFDAAALTSLRTPALSVVATRRLGVPTASRLVLFGTGPQAWGHLHAMASIRPISHVTVIGRRAERVAEFIQRARSAGLPVDPGNPSAVAAADIVCTCTTASQPLFDGMLLPAHAHVNAIGSHTPTARELDEATIVRASVVVENRASALAEAGDLIIPMIAGQVARDIGLTELAEVVDGALGADRLTVFKSVGVSLADLAAASEAYRRASA
ncbi:MAG: ornithine cyclodeaminase family protein [Streptosporangiaceae bacterium]